MLLTHGLYGERRVETEYWLEESNERCVAEGCGW
jgi:hypothetical protein